MTVEKVAAVSEAAQACFIMKELAKILPQITHEELKTATAEHVHQGLQVCEEKARKCIEVLVQALSLPQPTPELAVNAAWTLNRLVRHCEVTREWAVAAGCSSAIYNALCNYPEHQDLVMCSAWMTHAMGGLTALAALLVGMPTGDGSARRNLPDNSMARLVWVIHLVRKEELENGKPPPPESAPLLRLLLQLLATRAQDQDVLRSCCFAIEVLVRGEPMLGRLARECGALQLLIIALHRAADLGDGGEDLAAVCACALVSLVEGGSTAEVRALSQDAGIQEVLVQIATRGARVPAEEKAMIALGKLAGLDMVLQTMASHPQSYSVIRGGLDAIAQIAPQSQEEAEVKLLPKLLGALWHLRQEMNEPRPYVKCRRKCAAAVCSTIRSLAPFAGPGQVQELDCAVLGLVDSLHTEPWTDVEIAETVVEALGRLALRGDAWRLSLEQRGALQIAAQIIRNSPGQRKLVKYSFWFAATISGLPFVVQELRCGLHLADVVDAAFCTIIDILDEDVEGEWVLSKAPGGQGRGGGPDQCSGAEVLEILAIIVQAMHQHPSMAVLQSRGCHCIGLLLPLAPPSAEFRAVVDALFEAAGQHMHSSDVARDACYAFRVIFDDAELCSQEQLVGQLRQGQAEALAERALQKFAYSEEPGLLEDAVVVLSALVGIEQALKVLVESASPVRAPGIKAIFEFCRQHPKQLAGRSLVMFVANTVADMAQRHSEDHALGQNAALLLGLCSVHHSAAAVSAAEPPPY